MTLQEWSRIVSTGTPRPHRATVVEEVDGWPCLHHPGILDEPIETIEDLGFLTPAGVVRLKQQRIHDVRQLRATLVLLPEHERGMDAAILVWMATVGLVNSGHAEHSEHSEHSDVAIRRRVATELAEWVRSS